KTRKTRPPGIYSKKKFAKKYPSRELIMTVMRLILYMKKLLLLSVILLGMTSAAKAHVTFGFGFPLPLPGVTITAPAPVYSAPAPAYPAPAPACSPYYAAPYYGPSVYFGYGAPYYGWYGPRYHYRYYPHHHYY